MDLKTLEVLFPEEPADLLCCPDLPGERPKSTQLLWARLQQHIGGVLGGTTPPGLGGGK